MKRILLVLMTVMLLLAALPSLAEGELKGFKENGNRYVYVTLGRYPQTIDGGDPKAGMNAWNWSHQVVSDPASLNITPEPILWRVLTADEGKAYLCSEYVLFAHPTHTDVTGYKKIGKDFGGTQLSAYLNTEFAAEAFTAEELSLLQENGTRGRVFLLTGDDVRNRALGMGNGEGLKGWGTEYAIRVTKLFVYRTVRGSHSPYWVMDQCQSDPRHARCTKGDGSLGHIVSDRDNEGVRPAVYLTMGSFDIAGGRGTMDDPYVIAPKTAE